MSSGPKLLKVVKTVGLTILWLVIFGWQAKLMVETTLLVTRNNWSTPDYKAFYTSARSFWETGNAYPEQTPLIFSNLVLYNASPPPSMLIFLILALLPFEIALVSWYLISFTGLAIAYRWVWKVYPVGGKYPVWPFLLLFISSPFFTFVYLANWAGLLTFLVLASWHFLRKDDQVKGGIFLGLALVIRFQPLVIFLFLLVTKRWKAAISTIATAGAFYLAGLLALGVNNYRSWLTQALGGVSGASNNRFEHSWLGLVSNVFSLFSDINQPEINTTVRWLYYGLSLVTLAIILPLCRKVDFDRGYSMAIIAGLLVVAASSEYYWLMLGLPLLLLWRSYWLVCSLVVVRLIAHNSALLISFGSFDNLVWTLSLIIGMLAMLVCLYRGNRLTFRFVNWPSKKVVVEPE